jgi:hypothetical protein
MTEQTKPGRRVTKNDKGSLLLYVIMLEARLDVCQKLTIIVMQCHKSQRNGSQAVFGVGVLISCFCFVLCNMSAVSNQRKFTHKKYRLDLIHELAGSLQNRREIKVGHIHVQ